MASRLNRYTLINIALILISCACLVACGCPVIQQPSPKAGDGNQNPFAPSQPTAGQQTPTGQPAVAGQPPVAEQSPSAPKFTGKRYVLLVGVQAYGSPEFPDLSFTENDVDELTTAMTQSGYSRENITVLTKDKAVPRDILQKLRVIADKCTKDDVLFVGFAGHGFERPNPSNPDQRQQFFCGYGARKDQADTLVDLDQVYRILGDCRAGMKLIVMDACRNSLDRSLPPADPGHSSITSGNIPQGVLAFFSSSSGQRSYESPSLKHGVFFHYLIEAFQGKAQTSDGQLTWTNLVDHLKNNVGPYVKKNLNQTQDWHFQGNVNIHLPLAELPQRQKKDGSSTPDPKPSDTIVKTIPIGRELESWAPRITITLEKIEMRTDRRMRWYFSIWNQTGTDKSIWVSPGESGFYQERTYAVDQDGNKCKSLTHSLGDTYRFSLPDGVKVAYWIDFQEPLPGAKKLTAYFQKDPIYNTGLPTAVVKLTPDADTQPSTPAAEKRPGELILTTKQPIRKDVTAWVEVDGKRTDWKSGTTEVKLSLLSGAHRVVVKSIVQKKELTIYDKEIEVVADKSTTIDVGP